MPEISDETTWKMIDFLVRTHSGEDIEFGNTINPCEIKV